MYEDCEQDITLAVDGMSRLKIEGEVIAHGHRAGTTSGQASEALGEPLDRVLKCLIFVSRSNLGPQGIVGAVVTGNQRVDVQRLETASEVADLRLASPARVMTITGHRVGGIPPYLLPSLCRAFIDIKVLDQAYVVGSAGTPFIGVKIKPAELLRIGYVAASIAE
jgi:prolyl-tRNA editing enzyme YbaK/EbsC (Cys-tRNA(Pro) deacylase)